MTEEEEDADEKESESVPANHQAQQHEGDDARRKLVGPLLRHCRPGVIDRIEKVCSSLLRLSEKEKERK